MITKDKNKLKLEVKNKILVLGLMLLVLVGLFGGAWRTHAQAKGTCFSKGQTYPNWPRNDCLANSPNAIWSSNDAQKGTCTIKSQKQPSSWTAAECAASKGTWSGPYNLLAPIGDLTQFNPETSPTNQNPLGTYLNLMIKLIIGLAAVLAVVMIVLGGMEYMTSELISSKEAGRKRMTDAVLGLLIALGAWALLNTINPDLLDTNIDIDPVIVRVELDFDSPQTFDLKTRKYPNGVIFGADWAAIAGLPTPLPLHVTAKSPQCVTVGQLDCTSTRNLDISAVKAVQEGCRCVLVITGGTEFWLHGGKKGNTNHQRNGSTVDLRAGNPKLDAYLSGGKSLVKMQIYDSPVGPVIYEGNHWHIGT